MPAIGSRAPLSIAAAPYEMTRFYSMRDERTVKQAIAVAIGFQLLIGVSVLAIGLLTRVLFPNLPSADQASSVMAFEVLPPLVGALLIVAMVSAIMSTVNSILLVTGASVAHDLYGRFLRPDASESHLVMVNRIAIVVLAFIPVYFALQEFGDVQAIVVEQAKFIASFFLCSSSDRTQLARRYGEWCGGVYGGGLQRVSGLGIHGPAWIRVARHRRGGGGRSDEPDSIPDRVAIHKAGGGAEPSNLLPPA